MMDFFMEYITPIFLTILLICVTILIVGVTYHEVKEGFNYKEVTAERQLEVQAQGNTIEVK